MLKLPKIYHPDFGNPRIKPNIEVEIDWSNPLTRGLERLYIQTVGGMYDLVNRRYITNPHINAINSGTPTGQMRDYNGTDMEYDIIPSADRRYSTFGFVGRLDTLTADDRYITLGSSSTTTPVVFVGTDPAGTNTLIRHFYRQDGGSTSDNSTSSNMVQGDQFSISATVSNNYQSIKLNTENVVDASASAAGALTVDSVGFGGARRTTSSNQLDCKLAIVWLYDRALNEAEQNALHTNPYSLVRPRNEVMYFITAAGVTGSWLNRNYFWDNV